MNTLETYGAYHQALNESKQVRLISCFLDLVTQSPSCMNPDLVTQCLSYMNPVAHMLYLFKHTNKQEYFSTFYLYQYHKYESTLTLLHSERRGKLHTIKVSSLHQFGAKIIIFFLFNTYFLMKLEEKANTTPPIELQHPQLYEHWKDLILTHT